MQFIAICMSERDTTHAKYRRKKASVQIGRCIRLLFQRYQYRIDTNNGNIRQRQTRELSPLKKCVIQITSSLSRLSSVRDTMKWSIVSGGNN